MPGCRPSTTARMPQRYAREALGCALARAWPVPWHRPRSRVLTGLAKSDDKGRGAVPRTASPRSARSSQSVLGRSKLVRPMGDAPKHRMAGNPQRRGSFLPRWRAGAPLPEFRALQKFRLIVRPAIRGDDGAGIGGGQGLTVPRRWVNFRVANLRGEITMLRRTVCSVLVAAALFPFGASAKDLPGPRNFSPWPNHYVQAEQPKPTRVDKERGAAPIAGCPGPNQNDCGRYGPWCCFQPAVCTPTGCAPDHF
jgi:hypothetical protein